MILAYSDTFCNKTKKPPSVRRWFLSHNKSEKEQQDDSRYAACRGDADAKEVYGNIKAGIVSGKAYREEGDNSENGIIKNGSYRFFSAYRQDYVNQQIEPRRNRQHRLERFHTISPS